MTSGAKARNDKEALIAALKRCATQNRNSPKAGFAAKLSETINAALPRPAQIAFLLAVWLGTPLIGHAASNPEQPAAIIHYTVSLTNPAQHLVRVKIEVPPGAGEHDLQLPVWNALYQVRDFAQYVNWVRASSGAGQPIAVRKVDKSRWHVSGTEQGVEVEYEVFANASGPFGAQLNEQHAFFNLAEILMYPADERSFPIQLRFAEVPSGWRIATALPGSAAGEFSAPNYDRLADAPVEIGAFQESDFDEGGGHYRVVVDGDPADYAMQKIASTDRKIAAAETAWMDDRPFDGYVFIYHFPREPAGGGMEHANSTAIDISAKELAENPQSLADVTAHEFFHLWNVKRIRPQSLEPTDYTRENYTPTLWFSEGVTTTAANYAMLHAGLLHETRFLQGLASEIKQLEQRPARLTQSAEESSLDAWLEKYDYYWMPQRSISYYNKGYLLGIALDLQVREAAQGKASLRDIFQWLNENYARKGRFFPDSDGIRQAAEAVSHMNLEWFFQKYVAGMAEIPWDDFFKTVGLHLQQSTRSVADPGFSLDRGFGAPPSVTSVRPNSQAERAGLAAGDSVLQINGQTAGASFREQLEQLHPGDTLSLRVRGRSGEHELHWKVGSRQEVEFELKDVDNITPQQKARRAAWLKGESQPSGDARP